MAKTVQVNVTLDEPDNRLLNVVKATHDLKDKGQAMHAVFEWYRQDLARREIQREVAREPAWLDGEIKPDVAAAILRDTEEHLKRGLKKRSMRELEELLGVS